MNYEKFFKENYGQIRAFIYKMVLDWDLSCDLTQDTFISFYLVDKTGKEMNGSLNYLYMCARNKVNDYFTGKKRRYEVYDKFVDLDHVIIDNSQQERENELFEQHRFNMVMEELKRWDNTKGKDVMLKYYVEGLEPEEICKEMNIQKHSVYTHKNRIIEKLREKFGVVKI